MFRKRSLPKPRPQRKADKLKIPEGRVSRPSFAKCYEQIAMNEENREFNTEEGQQTRSLAGLKNLMWSLGIVVCCAALVIGTLIAAFHRNTGEKFGNPSSTEKPVYSGNYPLVVLEKTEDAGQEYVDSLVFLVDSTYINLRELELVGTNQVWATTSGSMSMDKVPDIQIQFPNDGSQITASAAAMIAKPEILVIGIGMDGLTKVDADTFRANYDSLIIQIQSASPNTKIVCCALPGVVSSYSGSDKIGKEDVILGNEWVQQVCMDTGAYFLNVQDVLSERQQLLSRFASSNNKTLNRLGIQEFLTYNQTHTVPD